MSLGKKVTELSATMVAQLQQDWRAGFLPVKVIALKYGIDLEDLQQTAKREKWEKDQPLQAAIEQAALEATVDRVVSDDDREHGRTEPRVMDRADQVKQFGMVVAGIQAEHRTVIKRARNYVVTLLQQLEELVGPHLEKDRIAALAKMIGDGDPEFVKILTQRVDAGDLVGGLNVLDKKAGITTKLTMALKELIALERAAYGLDKVGGAAAGYDELLDEIQQQRQKRLS